MVKVNQNFELYQGDSKVIELTVTDEETGGPLDLTGATVTWKLYASQAGQDLISKTQADGITITDAKAGVCEILLSSDETAELQGTFYHESRILDARGYASMVATGKAKIYPAH